MKSENDEALLCKISSFFLEQVSKRPGRYDEIPKSATMENRHNMEQQFYATVQRKTPALTPFASGGYEVDTIEQLKKAVRSKVNDKYTKRNPIKGIWICLGLHFLNPQIFPTQKEKGLKKRDFVWKWDFFHLILISVEKALVMSG